MSSERKQNNLYINYKFIFEDGSNKVFDLQYDKNNFTLLNKEIENPPEWTKLNKFRCSNCSLAETVFKHCPVAIHIYNIIDEFKDFPSYEKVEMEVNTPQRKYYKETSLQNGVSALLGVIMPTCGCPVLGKLKPLARFHLPFSSLEETEFRVFSMYLLAQYLKKKNGENPDWSLEGLKELYNDINILNQNVAQQVRQVENKDASVNAVIVLNNFVHTVTYSIEDDELYKIEPLFKEFLSAE